MNTRGGFSIVMLLLIVGIVALGAGVGTRYFIKNTGKSSDNEPSLSATKNQEPALVPQTTTTVTNPEFSACENITEQKAKNSCYMELAAVMKSQTPCEKIQDQYFRDKCIEIVVLATTPISPTQLAEARNTQRRSDVAAIVNAIGQRTADNRGAFETGCAAGAIPTASTKISSIGGYDLAPCITPTYIYPTQFNVLFDPGAAGAHYTSNTDYDTEYFIKKDSATGRISVSAPSAELSESIVVENDSGGRFRIFPSSNRCSAYHYSNCPSGCERRCVSSSCNGRVCSADCDGRGSCY